MNLRDGAVTVTLSNGATITIADGATSGTTTVPASDDVYVGGDTARDYHRCNGRQSRELLVKRPNSSNDDHQ
ncbi:hypothetical protein OK016_00065 [Vibrio chagasii]|nr:hypothetical protein [Vibrio chagasii]